MFFDYIRYLIKANTLHGTHSPFIYDFYQKIFEMDDKHIAYEVIEHHRKTLISNKDEITFEDFGAGSVRSTAISQRSIASIAKKSLKRPKWGRAFHRMIANYQLNTVIELGTSLGVTTAYMALANREVNITTFEGSQEVLSKAKAFFNEQHYYNIETVLGNIDKTLPEFLKTTKEIELVYIDANHRYEPTLRYFDLIYPHLSEKSIVIFDDIYWSTEMKKAWGSIKLDDRVRQTIDLFEIGIAFFRKSQEKEHFILKY